MAKDHDDASFEALFTNERQVVLSTKRVYVALLKAIATFAGTQPLRSYAATRSGHLGGAATPCSCCARSQLQVR